MNYIICNKKSNPTILRLHEVLPDVSFIRKFTLRNGDIRWKMLRDGMWQNLLRRNEEPTFTAEDKILFWGYWPNINTGEATVYNRVDRVRNKYEARLTLSDDGIPTPITSIDIDILDYPIIQRPFEHSGGRNFLVIGSEDADYDNGNYYYSEIYNKQREIRVHVAHGKVLFIQEKPLIEGVIQANREVTGEPWRVIPWNEYRTRYIKDAVNAVKSLHLDMGAVDVMINDTNTEMPVCICEVNTAPGLHDEYSLKRYSDYIKWLFRNNREWWNYEGWEAGKSYAFKNFQLEE